MGQSLGGEVQVKVIANQSAVYAALDDGAVLLNTDSGVYYGLDPVGTRIWELVGAADGASEEQIVRELRAEYEVDDDQLRSDVSAFLTVLEARGLLNRTAA